MYTCDCDLGMKPRSLIYAIPLLFLAIFFSTHWQRSCAWALPATQRLVRRGPVGADRRFILP